LFRLFAVLRNGEAGVTRLFRALTACASLAQCRIPRFVARYCPSLSFPRRLLSRLPSVALFVFILLLRLFAQGLLGVFFACAVSECILPLFFSCADRSGLLFCAISLNLPLNSGSLQAARLHPFVFV